MLDKIIVRGARTHNLKNIDVDIPKNQLVVITGLSGSGKSSLAFDTLYAEGQRRYVESLSAYARQFLQQMDKPEVDLIEGLSPAISIEQKATSHNPRSTVGTVTEIYDYLRLLFARAGTPYCPNHNISLQTQTVSQIVDNILALPNETKIMLVAPMVFERKGEHVELLAQIEQLGFTKVRIDHIVYNLDEIPFLEKNKKHTIEIVIDRLKVRPQIKSRLVDSVEMGLRHGNDKLKLIDLDTYQEKWFSAKFACPECDYSIAELEPRIFSFNSPLGACPTCDGLGHIRIFDPAKIIYPQLSLTEGAIKGWDKRNQYIYQILSGLAQHYKFSLEAPWQELPYSIQQLLLYGSKSAAAKSMGAINEHIDFAGIINILQQRYLATESSLVKEELAKLQTYQTCTQCNGTRLRQEVRCVNVGEHNISTISTWQLQQCFDYFSQLHLDGYKQEIATKIIQEILSRVKFLLDVGLDYLTLNRSADTLSGGEAQRIRLASQIGSGLTGVMYVLDEPSIGLHQRDNERLLATLTKLRDLGNTVIVVEHDQDAILSADYLIDIGPCAGEYGGEIIFAGQPQAIKQVTNSITGMYLSGAISIEVPKQRRLQDKGKLVVVEANANNLKNVNLEIPIANLVCITGVSGSGKSTLINDTLYRGVAYNLTKTGEIPNNFKYIHGLDHFDKVINVDQSPIGRTPRSNPATYTGLFTHIRELFTQLPLSRERGYGPGRFSFNVKGGRCEICEGDGLIKVEMHFLPDIYVTCDSCKGKRYNRETLEVEYKGKNIAQILQMPVNEAIEFFQAIPAIKRKLTTLMEVGLGYIRLGQSATTLSGGEAQRIKLALELSKRDTGRTLYILDEPTTGLHFYDIDLLLEVLHRFVDHGNTVVVIEHNLDVIKTADWVIDLGPEGGVNGGEIIAYGTPEQIVELNKGYTAKYLADFLN
ncbi:MAG: hypothetical protein RLZZ293_1177 [Pseudomonadota bacterium]|jgi:excinuclease ABC subunit A